MDEPPQQSALTAEQAEAILSRGEYDPPVERTGKTLNVVLPELLQGHEGVFLGESHQEPAILQSVARLMPSLKAAGVTTVSYEMPQSVMDTIQAQESPEAIRQVYPQLSPAQSEGVHALAAAAQAQGMTLLGHENPELFAYETYLRKRSMTEGEKLHFLLEKMKMESLQAVVERDAYAAAYIDERKAPGKTVVIGGKNHSKSLERDADSATHPGLNVRLGFPSVDFAIVTDEDRVQEIGQIYRAGNQGADYQVTLPSDLTQHFEERGWRSWPPAPENLPMRPKRQTPER